MSITIDIITNLLFSMVLAGTAFTSVLLLVTYMFIGDIKLSIYQCLQKS